MTDRQIRLVLSIGGGLFVVLLLAVFVLSILLVTGDDCPEPTPLDPTAAVVDSLRQSAQDEARFTADRALAGADSVRSARSRSTDSLRSYVDSLDPARRRALADSVYRARSKR